MYRKVSDFFVNERNNQGQKGTVESMTKVPAWTCLADLIRYCEPLGGCDVLMMQYIRLI